MNEKLTKAIEDVKFCLESKIFLSENISADMSDLGNEIGVAVAKHFSGEMGFDKESFLSGIRHGISLVDGTHL